MAEPTRPPILYLLLSFAVRRCAEADALASWLDENCTLWHYRDKDLDEVDLVIEMDYGALAGIEVKAGATVNTGDFKGLRKLATGSGKDFRLGMVLYDGDRVVPFADNLVATSISCLWAA